MSTRPIGPSSEVWIWYAKNLFIIRYGIIRSNLSWIETQIAKSDLPTIYKHPQLKN